MKNAEHIRKSGHCEDAQLGAELFGMVNSLQSAVPHRAAGDNSGFESIHGSSRKEEGENLTRTKTNLGVGKLWPSPALPASASPGVAGLAGASCLFQLFSNMEK